MSNCSQHKKDLFGHTDMKEVATAIGDLHYETLDTLLDNLAVKIHKDGIADYNSGRTKLGIALQNAALRIQNARIYTQEALEISKPFMNGELPLI